MKKSDFQKVLREAADALYFVWENRSDPDSVNWTKVRSLALRLSEMAEVP
ncbi:MAG: hypothetical protein QXG08_06375 [Candidatus Methanomethyliaceae archaeon]